MPEIPGLDLLDGNGVVLTDDGQTSLAEAALTVIVAGGGWLVTTATGGAVSPGAGSALLVGYIELLKILFPSGTQGVNVLDLLEDIYLDTQRWAVPSGNHYQLYIAELEQQLADAIAGIPAGGLTTEEHDHLIGLDPPGASTIGQAVWNHLIPHTQVSGGETDQVAALYLREGAEVDEWLAVSEGWALPGSRWWRVWCPTSRMGSVEWAMDVDPTNYYIPPDPDFTHVQAGDTLIGFLQREYPSITWTTIPTPRGNEARRYGFLCTGSGFDVYIGPAFTLPELAASHADMVVGEGIVIDVAVPPVWPGSAGATLGTPVALGTYQTIAGAMDGVLVEIASVDAHTLSYTYGDKKAWRHIGALAFFTDTGDLEQWQALGFESAIYTPKTMEHAAGVKLFSTRGATGTVTPWVRT